MHASGMTARAGLLRSEPLSASRPVLRQILLEKIEFANDQAGSGGVDRVVSCVPMATRTVSAWAVAAKMLAVSSNTENNDLRRIVIPTI